jgi:hypothetical protein
LGLRGGAEALQDAEHRGISGQHTETNRCDYGSEKDYGHKKRIHGSTNLYEGLLSDAQRKNPYTWFLPVSTERIFNLTALTLRAVDD